jgi:Tfp pilus assembly protein PilF
VTLQVASGVRCIDLIRSAGKLKTKTPENMIRPRLDPRLLSLLLPIVIACGGSGANTNATQTAAEDTSEGAHMRAGLDLLYKTNEPYRAETEFREVLRRTPTHYGATYQLATALDSEGRPTDARPLWEKVSQMAAQSKAEKTAAIARARLASPDTLSDGALMTSGVHMLYVQNQPEIAAEQFKKLLERHPTHYGATYQLAVALDKSGKRAEARPLWEKVLKMAQEAKDEKTASTAEARLKQNP